MRRDVLRLRYVLLKSIYDSHPAVFRQKLSSLERHLQGHEQAFLCAFILRDKYRDPLQTLVPNRISLLRAPL